MTIDDVKWIVKNQDRLGDIVDIIINDIERSKGTLRIAEDDLKEDYHAGSWKKHGLTKRQAEDRMQRWNGEVLGIEVALSTLYRVKDGLENHND